MREVTSRPQDPSAELHSVSVGLHPASLQAVQIPASLALPIAAHFGNARARILWDTSLAALSVAAPLRVDPPHTQPASDAEPAVRFEGFEPGALWAALEQAIKQRSEQDSQDWIVVIASADAVPVGPPRATNLVPETRNVLVMVVGANHADPSAQAAMQSLAALYGLTVEDPAGDTGPLPLGAALSALRDGDAKLIAMATIEPAASPLSPPQPTADGAIYDCLARLAEKDPQFHIAAGSAASVAFFRERLNAQWFEVPDDATHAYARASALSASGARVMVLLPAARVREVLGGELFNALSQRSSITLIVLPDDVPQLAHCDLAFLRLIPGMELFCPVSAHDACAQLERLAHRSGRPVALRMPRARWTPSGLLGSASRTVAQVTVPQVALIATGDGVWAAQRAAEQLASEGIFAPVVAVRRLRPLNSHRLAATLDGAPAAVIVEDACDGPWFGEDVQDAWRTEGLTPTVEIVRLVRCEGQTFSDRLMAESVAIASAARRMAQHVPLQPPPPEAEDAFPLQAFSLAELAKQAHAEKALVEQEQLSPLFMDWLAQYEGFGERGIYLWKWCARGLRLTALPGTLPEWDAPRTDAKLLSIMLNTLMDDVADQRVPGPLLEELLQIARGGETSGAVLNERDGAHAEFFRRLWNEYWNRVRSYPRYAEFEELLRYDLEQLCNAIQYSALLNKQPGMLNSFEHDLYSPHNTMMMTFATLDLMCHPTFDVRELGKLREAFWHAIWMNRIGNLLTTWQREVGVGDFTSGVFARAVELGDLTLDELAGGDAARISAGVERSGYLRHYLQRLHYHRQLFLKHAASVRSLALSDTVAGHDACFRMHLGSLGII